jgi:metal-responsive CopG/Arc/MetJ family transcriptional regulator
MRKVISVRLKEDILREIDKQRKDMGLDSRTEFIKKAIEFYMRERM